jgi:diguanylate cyclase (GGDEF)-like protein
VRRTIAGIALALTGMTIVGCFDWLSGIELRVYPLYFLPLSLGAWYSGRQGALALAAVAAMVWGFSNSAAGLEFSHPTLWVANLAMQLIGFATVGILITELRKRLGIEASLSRIDPLTGLANPRAFKEHIELVLALARRHPRPTSIAYIDLDNFKTVNDTKGHAEGDALLRAVAECVRRSIRTTDFAARLGGDEFALLLPESDRDSSERVIERLRDALGEVMRSNEWPVTASIGALVLATAPATGDEALRRVDEIMYRAKRSGKNRVVWG